MADRTTDRLDRPPGSSVGSAVRPDAATTAAPRRPDQRPISALEANPRRPPAKFGPAAEGWDAYNAWLARVRESTPPSRQAVIAKSLYSVSSYKSWADKARGAFDAAAPVPGVAGGKLK